MNVNGVLLVSYLPRVKERFFAWVDQRAPDECWEWKGPRAFDGLAYGRFSYSDHKAQAHRFAWVFANGPIPKGAHVLHSCDNPPCCNPAHLRIGTRAENMAEMAAKDRSAHGVKNGSHKLVPDQVRAIRADCRAQRVIAADYGVTQNVVGRIKRREIWRRVD